MLLVIGVLGPSPSVLDELVYLLKHGLLKKTVFVMPPLRSRPELEDQWRRAREIAAERELDIPPSHADGALFTINGSRSTQRCVSARRYVGGRHSPSLIRAVEGPAAG